jgi:Icc-related predicted phosphoesterase
MFRKRSIAGTTIFFCTDLHGSTVCFKKFINAAAYYTSKGRPVDVLIMGGDLTGKLIVPIIKQGGEYHSYLFGQHLTLTTQDGIDGLVKHTDILGIYPHIFEPDEYEVFKNSPEVQDRLFKELMLKRLEEWMDFAEKKLKDGRVRCYVGPGNDDLPEATDILEACPVVICPEERVVQIDQEHEMISLGLANITPFGCPGDVPEEELVRRIDHMALQVQDMSRCVFNLHCPPYGTGLDEAPLLDEELRPQIGLEGVEMEPVGCEAVRDAIEKHQPMLGLHGHVHESRGTARLGRTLCINPGSEYSEGILRGALVTIKKGEIVAHLLTSG